MFSKVVALSLAIVFLTQHGHGQNTGEITELTEEVVAKVGASAVLNCTVSAPVSIRDNILVEWVFLNATDGGKSVSSDCRITEEHNIVAGREKYQIFCTNLQNNDVRYSLVVNALSVPDNGIYECRSRLSATQDPTDRMPVPLTVLSPPTILTSASDVTVFGFIGGSAKLHCEGQGIPGPNVTWGRANGSPLPVSRYNQTQIKTSKTFTSTDLILYNLTKEDRGTYRCSADNNIRPPNDLFSQLIIEFAPSVAPVEPSYGSPTGENTQIMMWCKVDGFPRPAMTWYTMTLEDSIRYRDGKLDLNDQFFSNAKAVISDEKYSVEQKIMTVGSRSTMDSMFYSLTLLTVEPVDMVYYVCRAENKHGFASTAVQLYRVNTFADENNPASHPVPSLLTVTAIILSISCLFS